MFAAENCQSQTMFLVMGAVIFIQNRATDGTNIIIIWGTPPNTI